LQVTSQSQNKHELTLHVSLGDEANNLKQTNFAFSYQESKTV